MQRTLRESWEAISEVIPSADVGYTTFVADDNDFCPAPNSESIFAASSGSTTSSCLREDDFADAVAVTNGVANMREYPCHLRILLRKDALTRKKYLEEDRPQKRGSRDAAERGQKENQRRSKDAKVVQQITCSAKPAQKGCDGEAVDGGDSGAVIRRTVRGVADVEAADVQVSEAGNREKTEDETNAKAD